MGAGPGILQEEVYDSPARGLGADRSGRKLRRFLEDALTLAGIGAVSAVPGLVELQRVGGDFSRLVSDPLAGLTCAQLLLTTIVAGLYVRQRQLGRTIEKEAATFRLLQRADHKEMRGEDREHLETQLRHLADIVLARGEADIASLRSEVSLQHNDLKRDVLTALQEQSRERREIVDAAKNVIARVAEEQTRAIFGVLSKGREHETRWLRALVQDIESFRTQVVELVRSDERHCEDSTATLTEQLSEFQRGLRKDIANVVNLLTLVVRQIESSNLRTEQEIRNLRHQICDVNEVSTSGGDGNRTKVDSREMAFGRSVGTLRSVKAMS